MVIIIKNTLKKSLCLLVVLTALIVVDSFKINGLIGYKKVKEYIKEDVNIFSLAEGFFGKMMYVFYNTESKVNSYVYNIEKKDKGYIVYQHDEYLYSPVIGTVSKVEKEGDYYSVTIDTIDRKIIYKYLLSLEVNIYDKVEVDTILAIVDGWYYYEEN